MKSPMILMALLTLGTALACGPVPDFDEEREGEELETSTSALTRVGVEPDEIDDEGAPSTPGDVTATGEEGKPPPPPPPPPPPVLPSETLSLNFGKIEIETTGDVEDDVTPDGETAGDATRDDGSDEEAVEGSRVKYGPVITVKPKG